MATESLLSQRRWVRGNDLQHKHLHYESYYEQQVIFISIFYADLMPGDESYGMIGLMVHMLHMCDGECESDVSES